MIIGAHEFWTFLLVFTRVSALFVASPIFSLRAVPRRVMAGLAALITFALIPIVSPRVVGTPADPLTLVSGMAVEASIGLCLGFFARMIFAAFEIAGQFIDIQIGFSIMTLLNPLSDQHSAVIGQFLYQAGTALFLLAGGHLFLIGAVAGSYSVVPPAAAHFAGNASSVVTSVAGQMFVLSLKIALPAAAILLIVDVAFAIIARTMPQLNVLLVGTPAKIIVGLFTVAIVLPSIAMVVGQFAPTIDAGFQSLLQAVR